MAEISGQLQTAGSAGVNAEQLKIDMDTMLHYLNPNAGPFARSMMFPGTKEFQNQFQANDYNGFVTKMKPCASYKTEWLEDQMDPRVDAVNYGTGYGTVVSTFAVDNGSYFRAGMVIRNNSTGEVMRVRSVSGNDLTTTRNLNANGSGYAISDNDEIRITGDAQAEGSGSSTAMSTQTSELYNYTQIFKQSIELSRTLRSTAAYTGDERKRQQMKKAEQMLEDIENSILFGVRYSDTSSSPIRTMGGLTYFITTNVTAVNGVLTETAFNNFLKTIALSGGPGERTMLASPRVLQAISGFASSKVLTSVDATKYGVNITKYQTPLLTLNIIQEPVFNATYSSGAGWTGGHAIVLDTSSIELNYLEGNGISAKPALTKDIQIPGTDGYKDEWLGEMSLKVFNEKRHGILTGVTA